MIPMVLVTGFLGTGKTTYLGRLVRQYRDRRVIYLVNEFSPVDIDGRILHDEEAELVAIPGGSIFCKCLVTQFIYHLDKISREYGTPQAPIEGVVIEASGIADPRVVQQMLEETGLDDRYDLRNVVTVVDPASFLGLIQVLPNITAQIEASSLVILNKVDCCDEATVAGVEAELKRINPAARIVKTCYAEVDFDPFARGAVGSLVGEYALCADPRYAAFHVRLDGPVDWPRLKAALLEQGPDLYRAKGFVPISDGTLYVDCSAAGVKDEPVPPGPDQSELVLIAAGRAREKIELLVAEIEKGVYRSAWV